jgi:hypothetical protein
LKINRELDVEGANDSGVSEHVDGLRAYVRNAVMHGSCHVKK